MASPCCGGFRRCLLFIYSQIKMKEKNIYRASFHISFCRYRNPNSFDSSGHFYCLSYTIKWILRENNLDLQQSSATPFLCANYWPHSWTRVTISKSRHDVQENCARSAANVHRKVCFHNVRRDAPKWMSHKNGPGMTFFFKASVMNSELGYSLSVRL